MTANAIEAIQLSKRFRLPTERRTSFKERFVRGRAPKPKEFWALKDATFSVPRGSSLGLIGQNGSGKSTALKVLTGIYRPTSGQVHVHGSVSALLEVGAGFHPELTGRENVRLNATILGFTNREIDRLMGSIIEFADIGEHIEAPIKHYSSGMYVRLGFAVAVMVRPEILLVDEVIAVGDEDFQRKCHGYLYDLRRAGTSMIVVSHGLSEITDLCDDAVWLDHGEVRGIGSSRKVVRAYLEEVNEREAEREGGGTGTAGAGHAPVGSGGPAASHLSSTDPAAAAEERDPADPFDGIRRRGSGQVRVEALELLDQHGQPANLLISGLPCKFRLHFEAHERVQSPVFGLGFDNQAEIVVGGVNSSHCDPWVLPPGRGFVEFRAQPLLLAAGTYRIRTQVHAGSHILDAVDDGFSVTVRAPDVEMAGTYLQPGDWTLHVGAGSGFEDTTADSRPAEALNG